MAFDQRGTLPTNGYVCYMGVLNSPSQIYYRNVAVIGFVSAAKIPTNVPGNSGYPGCPVTCIATDRRNTERCVGGAGEY